MKRLLVFAFVFVFAFSFVCAVDTTELESGLEGAKSGAEKTQEFFDAERYDYLAESWQKLFLENKYISAVNGFFEKINIVFVFLLARNYSFSLEMLFAFMLWLFTLLSIPGYLIVINNSYYRDAAALALTVLLAHLQIFNFISTALVKMLFFRSSMWWSIATFVFIMVAIFLYLFINKYFAKIINRTKEKNKDLDKRLKRIEAETKAQDKASS